MRAFGIANLRSPAASKIAAMDSQCPTHTVYTGAETCFMVSYNASPAVTLPPPEFKYITIGNLSSTSFK